ncbi:TPA: restriction endonuclease subunit S [Listeria innocua]|uniref:restriction endonuclease subunit S n=1 Tax=Listeria innocua TaxID=1642 RepID=UPI0010DE3024|nr:restriction endonuclease subunit S [Listeria innocua]EHZ6143694.1 restriction endonuclease subunit S [Listeria monocytogenes]MDH4901863.1 restriction endonuclease subunit S [Listeria innocua]HBM3649143.1 restriction endonuclease subunit S [Listeria innocua]HBM3768978.1 restriction endonuclease subunit S [Listeria innocua]HBM3898664.1 restriction endonuclease subunit S [Listeria innocua]
MKKLEKSVPVIRFKGFSEAWEQRKLGELGEVTTGKAFSSTSFDNQGEYLVITNKNISDSSRSQNIITNRISISDDEIIQRYRLDGENILVTMDGVNLGKTAMYSNANALLAQRVGRIKSNQLEFIYQITSSNTFLRTMQTLSVGNAIKHISLKQISEYSSLGPKDIIERKKIGSFFKKLDNAIALHQRKLDALKLMKKAFSQQIFPENNRKKPKIRFTSFYEEWEQRKIGEYGYFYYGKSAPKWSVAQDATTPCVRYGELYTKFGPEIDIVHSYTNIDKSNLKFSSGNEVLVPRVGENPLDFANCSWLSISNVAIGEMISVYNTEQYPLFIAYYFRSKMKYEFAKRVEGGNVSNLYYSYLEDILISVPSIEEQKKIAEFLNKIDITINLLQNKLGRIKELKKAYLQNMFI